MYRNYRAKKGVPRVKRGALYGTRGNIRFKIGKAILLAFALIIMARLFNLQILEGNTYRALASQQYELYRELFPERGEILIEDRVAGIYTPLATNQDLYLVYADPRLIENSEEAAQRIAPILGIAPARHAERNKVEREIPSNNERDSASPPALQDDNVADEYQQLLDRLSKTDDPYEPLQHGVSEKTVEAIKNLGIAGIDAVREPVRYYPFRNVGAHVAGFIGSDGEKITGRYGMELAFNKELAGESGFFEGERDIAGRWIPVGRRTLHPAVDGDTVALTVERAVQYFTCTKLNEAVAKHGASGGSAIVVEAQTGAILAMCGSPDFDPNAYFEVDDIAVYNNPAVFGQYEPGSVFKAITMAAALDTGAITPETVYEDTGEVRIGPHRIRNADLKAHGRQTMTQVLEASLNTGAIFAARKVKTERFRDYAERFGFGVKTGIGLPGEAAGDTRALRERGDIFLATASFGQGIAVTPIQLTAAFGAIANQGKLMRPYIVKEVRSISGAVIATEPKAVREVISARTATLLSGMLTSVVEKGHGGRAGVDGYFVAGKTGTAQIPRKDGPGYETGETIGTFVGFAPAEQPRFVVFTRIDRPKDVRFAESSAAPLFGEIMNFLLQYYEIKPTRPMRSSN